MKRDSCSVSSAEISCASEESEEADWSVYITTKLLNCFFFGSDYVIAHGVAHAVEEADVNHAHKKLLGELAPIAGELSEFTFGFFAVLLKKYVGQELTATVVAKFADAPSIDEMKLPFYVEF